MIRVDSSNRLTIGHWILLIFTCIVYNIYIYINMILIALIVYNCNCCIVAIIKRHKVAVQRYICIEYCRVLHRLTTGTLSTDLIRQARVRSSWQFHSFHRENVPLSSNSTAMLTSPHMSGDTCGKSSHLQRI